MMQQIETIFKALSDRNRLRIVAALMLQDELCACQITQLIGVAGATASRHLGILQRAGLIDSRKDGRWVYFRLCRDDAPTRGLFEWTETQLKKDPDAADDMKKLSKILKQSPEEICRRQRGATCCPAK